MALLAFNPKRAPLFTEINFELPRSFLLILGIAILTVAAINLKPSLRVSPIPMAGAPLITVGIYKFFRHPMYLGVLFIAAGISLGKLDIYSILIWVSLFVTLCVKASFEDGLLRANHAHALEYQSRVKGLPKLFNI